MNDLKAAIEARSRAEKEDRVRNILSASKKLFLKKGYFSTTMRDICREAALSIGAVYFYFSGKEEIYARVCEECFLFLLALFEKSIDKNAPALQQLESARKAYLAFYTHHNDQWVILRSGFRNSISSPVLLGKLEAIDSRLLAMFQEMVARILEENNLAEHYDATETTFALWAGVEGLLIVHNHKYLQKEGLNLESLADKQFRLFLKGLFGKDM